MEKYRSFPQWKHLALAACLATSGHTLLLADDPTSGPAVKETQEKAAEAQRPAGVPHIVTEFDRNTKKESVYLVYPNGEKKLVQLQSGHAVGQPGTISPEASQEFLKALESLARSKRYIIGVQLAAIPEGIRDRLKLEKGSGVLVASVLEGKPAAEAGIKQNDILLKIDGTSVDDPEDVVRIINDAKTEAVTLSLLRGDEKMELKVTPHEAKGDDVLPSTVAPHSAEALPPNVRVIGPGMMVSPMGLPGLMELKGELSQLRELNAAQQQKFDKAVNELQNDVQELRDQNAALLREVETLKKSLQELHDSK